MGRPRELEAVSEMLSVVARGAAMVVRGHAGVGKTRLLGAAGTEACQRGMSVVEMSGVREEAGTPWAGLHQLIAPFSERIRDLPAPRRDAVRATLGLAAGRPNPLFVALGVMELLAAQAAGRALLVTVDNAQWLDPASSEVLAIVARRLAQERIILLCAARFTPRSRLDGVGLRELRLDPLDQCASLALLDKFSPGLSGPDREAVLAAAAGNPLALRELPRALRKEGSAERLALPSLPALPPLTARLEEAFSVRGLGLPAATRRLLLIVAANDRDDLSEVLRAAASGGQGQPPIEALGRAIRAGLVQVDGTVIKFRHPLIAAAVYQEASPGQRHAAHAALAEHLSGQPERRTWHEAATATGPDEAMAMRLDRAASIALRQGAVTAAAAAAERAALLSCDPATRERRLLRAAELACEIGKARTARQLVSQVRPLRLRAAERARLAWLEQAINPGRPGDREGLHRLIALAGQASEDGEPDLAVRILGNAAFRCFLAGHDGQSRQLIINAIEAVPQARDDFRALSARAFADPVSQGQLVVDTLSRAEVGAASGDPAGVFAAGAAAVICGSLDIGADWLARAVASLRAQGRQRHLARALTVQAWAAAHRADWEVAEPAATEAIRLARQTEQPAYVVVGQVSRLMVAAMRGDEERAGSLATEAERRLAPVHARLALSAIQAARGLCALSAARYDDAWAHLRRIFDRDDPAYHHGYRCWGVADLAEAAARSGHRDEANRLLSEVLQSAGNSQSPVLRAGLQYARALLADDDEADTLFRSALGPAADGRFGPSTELARFPFYWTRAQFAHGTWLRRQRRIAESRQPLRAAASAFDALGFARWAERARQELRAAGETDHRGKTAHTDAVSLLSPQEFQIAEMAASGMSNREIGAQLYLSHRTVAAHLYRIFPKLGITSRMQMPAVLHPARPVAALSG